MKKLLLELLFVSTVITAQNMKVVKGDYATLKDQKEFNVEFTYENLKLMKDNLTNDQYVSERVADLNEKNNGVGGTWKTKWYSSRELSFEPKFLDLVNIVLSKKGKEIVFKQKEANR